MSTSPVRVGLVGCGAQALEHYVPYFLARSGAGGVRVAWVSGYLDGDGRAEAIAAAARDLGCDAAPGDAWLDWLDRADAVVVSLPNALHAPAVRAALAAGVHVAVDKPTTVCPDECTELVRLAADRGRVFVTVSQRRYEEVYRAVRGVVAAGELGHLTLARYLMSHPHYDRGRSGWTTSRALAGGGSLMQSGYHGLDTLLWLFRHNPPEFGGALGVASVSAECAYESPGGRPGSYPPAATPDGDQVESVASLRMRLTNGALFELTASYANPAGSVDEVFQLIGDGGMVRFARERPVKKDMSAGSLSYQGTRGEYRPYDTSAWVGNRTAPVDDFLAAVRLARAGQPWAVLSPAAESVETLRVIRAAYRSAADGGRAVAPAGSPGPRAVHHVAVQTAKFDDALRFYTDVLGMRVLSNGPFKRRMVAWLRAGNVTVELFSNRSGEALEPWGERFPGPIHLAFEVENLRAFLAWAAGRGAVLHPSHPVPFRPPVEGAGEIAYLLGPDGEEVEVRERE